MAVTRVRIEADGDSPAECKEHIERVARLLDVAFEDEGVPLRGAEVYEAEVDEGPAGRRYKGRLILHFALRSAPGATFYVHADGTFAGSGNAASGGGTNINVG